MPDRAALDIYLAMSLLSGGVLLCVYSGRKRFAVGQVIGLTALMIGAALFLTSVLLPVPDRMRVPLPPGVLDQDMGVIATPTGCC